MMTSDKIEWIVFASTLALGNKKFLLYNFNLLKTIYFVVFKGLPVYFLYGLRNSKLNHIISSL